MFQRIIAAIIEAASQTPVYVPPPSKRRNPHGISYTKKGPGRKHKQGVATPARRMERKLRSCGA